MSIERMTVEGILYEVDNRGGTDVDIWTVKKDRTRGRLLKRHGQVFMRVYGALVCAAALLGD